MTQFLIEEATCLHYDAVLQAEIDADQPPAEPARPGAISDPVMQDAMAAAKQLHFERTGVRVK